MPIRIFSRLPSRQIEVCCGMGESIAVTIEDYSEAKREAIEKKVGK